MKEESILQAAFFKAANNDPYFRYCIWSTPNGIYLSGNMAAANEMKSTGALPGVWDLTIQKDGELFFIETKIGSNGLTKEQKHFKKVRIENGIPESNFFVYRTLEEGMEILETIKNLNKTP